MKPGNNKRRMISLLLAMIMLFQSLIPFNAAFAGTPGPGYQDPSTPQILMTNLLNNDPNLKEGTYYTDQTITAQVGLDGTHL